MNTTGNEKLTDQLKNLFDYTKFHIGLYSGLTATCIALLKFGRGTNLGSARYFLYVTAIAFVIAGICGGIIASSVCEYATFESFSKARLGFWGIEILRFKYWARAEHSAFWIGVMSAVIGLLAFKS